MSDSVEGGAAIAWRLLATLEGGSLLLGASALLAYMASSKVAGQKRREPCNTVLLTNATNELGKELKRRLEMRGCTVSAVTSGATSDAGTNFDALVVVGAKPKTNELDGISDLVTEDVCDNLKLLESLSLRVRRGGCIAWACAGADTAAGAFTGAATAFDGVLQASLLHVAKVHSCYPIWVGRCDDAAERLVAVLTSTEAQPKTRGLSIRLAANKMGEYLYRWLKTIT